MIELRWFQPKPPGHGYGVEVKIPEKRLQYRVWVTRPDGGFWEWGDWQDVPTVQEAVESSG